MTEPATPTTPLQVFTGSYVPRKGIPVLITTTFSWGGVNQPSCVGAEHFGFFSEDPDTLLPLRVRARRWKVHTIQIDEAYVRRVAIEAGTGALNSHLVEFWEAQKDGQRFESVRLGEADVSALLRLYGAGVVSSILDRAARASECPELRDLVEVARSLVDFVREVPLEHS